MHKHKFTIKVLLESFLIVAVLFLLEQVLWLSGGMLWFITSFDNLSTGGRAGFIILGFALGAFILMVPGFWCGFRLRERGILYGLFIGLLRPLLDATKFAVISYQVLHKLPLLIGARSEVYGAVLSILLSGLGGYLGERISKGKVAKSK